MVDKNKCNKTKETASGKKFCPVDFVEENVMCKNCLYNPENWTIDYRGSPKMKEGVSLAF